MLTLQEIVDGLGRRLGVPVTLEDVRMRLLVHNAHEGEVDRARQQMILARHADEWALSWGREIGLFDTTVPMRTPPVPERGVADERVVVPIRWEGRLLGWMWLLDGDVPLTEDDLADASVAADHAAVILNRSQRANQQLRHERTEAIRALFSDDDAERRRAATTTIEAGLLAEGPVRVAVFATRDTASQSLSRIEDLGHRMADLLPSDEAHAFLRGSHAVVLAVARGPLTTDEDRLEARIGELLDNVAPRGAASRPHVGIGSVKPSIVQAEESYQEAVRAATVARVETPGGCAHWNRIGVYRVLLSLPQPVDPALIHPGVAALAAEGEDTELLDTAEVFLDECGKAARASALLHVHRGTLYYRLKRFGEMADCDLDDGADRQSVHLALKALRLTR